MENFSAFDIVSRFIASFMRHFAPILCDFFLFSAKTLFFTSTPKQESLWHSATVKVERFSQTRVKLMMSSVQARRRERERELFERFCAQQVYWRIFYFFCIQTIFFSLSHLLWRARRKRRKCVKNIWCDSFTCTRWLFLFFSCGWYKNRERKLMMVKCLGKLGKYQFALTRKEVHNFSFFLFSYISMFQLISHLRDDDDGKIFNMSCGKLNFQIESIKNYIFFSFPRS